MCVVHVWYVCRSCGEIWAHDARHADVISGRAWPAGLVAVGFYSATPYSVIRAQLPVTPKPAKRLAQQGSLIGTVRVHAQPIALGHGFALPP